MITLEIKQQIEQSLYAFADGSFKENVHALFETLGYRSVKQIDLDADTGVGFMDTFNLHATLNTERALLAQWQTVSFLFQLTADEIGQNAQVGMFSTAQVDNSIIESYLFLAIELHAGHYTRGDLARATREINKQFPMPVLVLFKHRQTLTLSIINRRLHRRDSSKDVLEKVTLIKDINFTAPHRAHIEILFDLSLNELLRVHRFTNFVELHRAWQTTLDSSALNKRFFKEIANWYFWAVKQVVFPTDAGASTDADADVRNATSMIRLITRLIFVWFLKEKGLVPDALFNRGKLDELLTYDDPQNSTYYKAILQNLFFATLNQEMNTPQKPHNRQFRQRSAKKGGRDKRYMVHSFYRYKRYFKDSQAALGLFSTIPFLNGGLFECLDKSVSVAGKAKTLRIDGFSDRDDNVLTVPDALFFNDAQDVDLNPIYGTRGKRYKVRGLIDILNSYKFTIAENTPIEEEIALDPELLGKVFENLLAAYNPETETTARKQTGSFYTPREIVNYMVDESLVAYLESANLRMANEPSASDDSPFKDRLRHLLAYNESPHSFIEAEVVRLIAAIDRVKILDPACGSGAFPMGMLHKLVFILNKLDPDNELWRATQRNKAIAQTAQAFLLGDKAEREGRLLEINDVFERNASDYGRKLYLIENCIYGVDIQPVAVQIAKLRFFISLVVDQRVDDQQPNRGVRPLPNLETKFVAANTLLGVDKPQQISLFDTEEIQQKEAELKAVRAKHFTARTLRTKRKYRAQDEALRAEIAQVLERSSFPAATVHQLATWNPYEQNTTADFFDPEWMFGIQDGFDMVIGNPPYVRQEKIRHLKPALKAEYDCYTGTADLYVYFFERGFRVLKVGGVLTYISSNKYFRAGYGKKLRHYLSQNSTIQQLIDFGDAPVFTAIAYPSIITLQKNAPVAQQTRAFTWEPGPPIVNFADIFASEHFLISQSALTAEGWRLEPPEVLALLDKLRQAGTPLGEYVEERFYYGIKTGYNKAFVIDRATRDRLISEHPSSAEVIKPFLRGKDVKRWIVKFAEQYLIKIESSQNVPHPWSKKSAQEAEAIFAQTYPAIHAHFETHRERLVKRSDQGHYFWELRACAYWKEFEQPKIAYPDIAQRTEFAYDSSQHYLANTLYLIPTDEKWLLGLLNSSLIYWFYTKISTKIRGGFVRFIAQYVSQIPIPTPTAAQRTAIETFVEYLLYLNAQSFYKSPSLAHARDHVMGSYFEQISNGLVYELYLPEELHAAGKYILQPVLAANFPRLDALREDKLTALRAIFERTYDKNHPLRKTLFFLDSLESIRIIEGKQ